MTLYAYDGASPFDLEAAKRHGAILITGYIVGHPGGMDPITTDRIRQIHALGMGFLPNWERGASDLVVASHLDGLAAGREAVSALRQLGVPDDGTIACPFSWDTNIPPDKYPHCGDVADAIIDGLAGHYRFTAYGQGGLIDYFAQTRRLQSEGWLSASSSFPGYDAASPRVALVQRVGSPVAGTDQDIVTDPANVHAWWPAGSPYAQEEDPMAGYTLDQIAAAVWAHQQKLWNGSTPTTGEVLSTLHQWSNYERGVLAKLNDPTTLAAAIVAKLPPAGAASSLSAADVEAAVRAVFADAATP